MNSDGYKMSRLQKFELCSSHQNKINTRLKEIAIEMISLPQMPSSMEEWVTSWPDLSTPKFGMNTYSKHCQNRKEYSKLIENANDNLREMKILTIEELLEKIAITLNTK